MSGSDCCFLTCIQISQEASKVAWYSYLFKNFSQFVVIHTVKGFSIVIEAEIEVLLEFSCFFYDLTMFAIWSLVPLPFLNPICTSKSSRFTYGEVWYSRILSITFLAFEKVPLCSTLFVYLFVLALPFFGVGMKIPFPVLWPLLNFPNLPVYWVQHFNWRGKVKILYNLFLLLSL